MNENEKIEAAVDRALELMSKNGLSGWTVEVSAKRSIIAETFHASKTIRFSKFFMLTADKDQFDGVTLHEVAHAILGAGYGHNADFIRLCLKISPTASYACENVNIPLNKYILTCPRCGHTGSSSNTKNKYCARCFNNGGNIVEFNVTENKREVTVW